MVGAFVALFQFFSFYIFFNLFGLYYLLASTVSFFLTVVVSFTLQKGVTFKNGFFVSGSLEKETVRFSIFLFNALFGLLINAGTMYVGVTLLSVNVYIAQVLSIAFLASYNFFVYRLILR